MSQPDYPKYLSPTFVSRVAEFAQAIAATAKDVQSKYPNLANSLDDNAKLAYKGASSALSTVRLIIENGLKDGLREGRREAAVRENGVPMRKRSVSVGDTQQFHNESPSLEGFYNIKNSTARQSLYTRLTSDFIGEPDPAKKQQFHDTMAQLAKQGDQTPTEKDNARAATLYMAYWLALPSPFPVRHPMNTEGMDVPRAMALLDRMPVNQLRHEDESINQMQTTQMVEGLHQQHAQQLSNINSSKDHLVNLLADDSGSRSFLSIIGRDVHEALLQIKLLIQQDRVGADLLDTSGLSEKQLTRALVEKDIKSQESLWDRVFNPMSDVQLSNKVTEVMNKVALEALVSAHANRAMSKIGIHPVSTPGAVQPPALSETTFEPAYERQRG